MLSSVVFLTVLVVELSTYSFYFGLWVIERWNRGTGSITIKCKL